MFRAWDRVRLVHEVDTFTMDPQYDDRTLDYQEYERLQEPLRLRKGVVADFESYLVYVEGLAVLTPSRTEAERCQILVGPDRHRIEVPASALEACDPAEPLTPLDACAVALGAGETARA